jgi:hypothetical protein
MAFAPAISRVRDFTLQKKYRASSLFPILQEVVRKLGSLHTRAIRMKMPRNKFDESWDLIKPK